MNPLYIKKQKTKKILELRNSQTENPRARKSKEWYGNWRTVGEIVGGGWKKKGSKSKQFVIGP